MRALILSSILFASPALAADPAPFTYRDVAPGMCTIPTSTEKVEDGRDGELSLYLFASGNYAVAYEEHTPSCAGVPGECRYDVPVVFFDEGKWSESDGVIALPGFGSARIDGQQLDVTVTDARAAASARSHTFKASVVGSSVVAYTLRKQMEYRGYTTTLPEVRDAVYTK
ncbi:MAG: hypothetical protein U1F43_06405 [Myxococcota bacterium]